MLLPVAAFAVHQLRYELAYGSHSGAALAAQGHGYLDSFAPWLGVLVALGLGSFLTRLARAAGGRADVRPRRSFATLAGLASLALLLTYSLQEWLEGIFAVGHPSGFEGVFGHGGYWAVPLSLLAGLLVAALLRFAAVAVEVAARLASVRPLTGSGFESLRPTSFSSVRLSPLARRSAGRAPPPGIGLY
jgi:hypothetical protein